MKVAFYWFWQTTLVLSFSPLLGAIYLFLTNFNQSDLNMFAISLIVLICALCIIMLNNQALKRLRAQCAIAEHKLFAGLDISPYAIMGLNCMFIIRYYNVGWLRTVSLASPLIAGIITIAFHMAVEHNLAAKLPARKPTKKED